MGMIRMSHVVRIGFGVALSFMALVSAAQADDFKLSHNQRIACSRGLAAGKLNTATCKSYAYVFNVKTSEYFRCQVSLALTRDNKEVINVQTDGGCTKKPRVFENDFKLLVRCHRDRASEYQFVLRYRRLCYVGQRQQRAEGARLHHHLVRPRLRHLEMPRHVISVTLERPLTASGRRGRRAACARGQIS